MPVDLGFRVWEPLVQVLSNHDWRQRLDRVRPVDAPNTSKLNAQDRPECQCGCGAKLTPGRTFASRSHQKRWMNDGGASDLARELWARRDHS
jgi:hypothetical protein